MKLVYKTSAKKRGYRKKYYQLNKEKILSSLRESSLRICRKCNKKCWGKVCRDCIKDNKDIQGKVGRWRKRRDKSKYGNRTINQKI